MRIITKNICLNHTLQICCRMNRIFNSVGNIFNLNKIIEQSKLAITTVKSLKTIIKCTTEKILKQQYCLPLSQIAAICAVNTIINLFYYKSINLN